MRYKQKFLRLCYDQNYTNKIHKKLILKVKIGSGTTVEHLPHNPKAEDSNQATKITAGREFKRERKSLRSLSQKNLIKVFKM
jgi:hypothetical protein